MKAIRTVDLELLVIVSVQSGELAIIFQAVTNVAGIARHAEEVALGLTLNCEMVILSPKCLPVPGPQLHPELLVSSLCQLVDLVQAKPELLFLVTKPTLVISPTPPKVLSGFSKITAPLKNHSPVVCL